MIREEVLEVWRELKGKFLSELSKCHHDCIRFYCPRPNGEPDPEITCDNCGKSLLVMEEID